MDDTDTLTDKQKIILKLYTKYIMKKFLTRKQFNKNDYNFNKYNKILINNKFLLESILNKKYFNQDNHIEYNTYSTMFHKLTYN